LKSKKSIITGLVLLGILSLILCCSFEVSIGSKTFNKGFQHLNGDRSIYSGVFHQTGWDGPTGSFTSGEIYALRIGDWLLYFSVDTDNSPRTS
jgi:hypothetical protein